MWITLIQRFMTTCLVISTNQKMTLLDELGVFSPYHRTSPPRGLLFISYETRNRSNQLFKLSFSVFVVTACGRTYEQSLADALTFDDNFTQGRGKARRNSI